MSCRSSWPFSSWPTGGRPIAAALCAATCMRSHWRSPTLGCRCGVKRPVARTCRATHPFATSAGPREGLPSHVAPCGNDRQTPSRPVMHGRAVVAEAGASLNRCRCPAPPHPEFSVQRPGGLDRSCENIDHVARVDTESLRLRPTSETMPSGSFKRDRLLPSSRFRPCVLGTIDGFALGEGVGCTARGASWIRKSDLPCRRHAGIRTSLAMTIVPRTL